MVNCRKTIALITVMILTLSVFSAISFAEIEEVISYCERVDVNVEAVNLGGEDVTVEGAPFTGERNAGNIKTFEREPVELGKPYNTTNALSRIEAEDFTLNNGVEVEDTGDVDGKKNLSYISNGDYVSYEDIYFPKGTKGFIARVASDTEGGYIELRLNSPSGELVGRTRVDNTGDWQDYTEVYCELNKNVSGVHTLFLGFVGDREGLFNVNWFRFTKSAYDPIMTDSYDEKNNGAYQ